MELGKLLSINRSEDSYLAGGAAILATPNSKRYDQDLDYFQDSTARVASAFSADQKVLESNGFKLNLEINQPGYISAIVSRQKTVAKIEWAQDSSWRFMPVIKNKEFGYQLHPIDLATNKVLALAGRDEARDVLDTLFLHKQTLELGPMIWAAVGKDPGFSPMSLLEILKRRGKVRPEELTRLHLSEIPDIKMLKSEWLEVIQLAESFINTRPPEEVGCLYFSMELKKFINPQQEVKGDVIPHYGRPGGVLPKLV